MLPESEPAVANVHLNATEHNERIVFLHHVLPGPASQSYGLAVAQLAGVPAAVIQRAREHLARLETTSLPHETPSDPNGKPASPMQSDLFASLPHPVIDEEDQPRRYQPAASSRSVICMEDAGLTDYRTSC